MFLLSGVGLRDRDLIVLVNRGMSAGYEPIVIVIRGRSEGYGPMSLLSGVGLRVMGKGIDERSVLINLSFSYNNQNVDMKVIQNDILQRAVDGMRNDGIPYKGII